MAWDSIYAERNRPKHDLTIRHGFDSQVVGDLENSGATVAIYDGYMSIVSSVLLERFWSVGVHPADLSLVDEHGGRKYVGANAVRDAILAGEKELRSSTYLLDEEIDEGPVFMISEPLEVQLVDDFDPTNKKQVRQVAREHQTRLKKVGDWQIFPKTVLNLSQGKFAIGDDSRLYFKNNPIPNGIRL